VAICNTNRANLGTLAGVPWVIPIVLGVLGAWTILLQRTKFGRYVYAIGGNAEAARRAGVNVALIRTVGFGLCSFTAGVAMLLYASLLGGMSNNVGGGQYVLYAVAAAVIASMKAASISSLVLMHPGSQTHAFDMDQRLVGVSFIAASGVLELKEAMHKLPAGSRLPLIVATIVSGVVGYISIWFLLRFLRTHSTGVFIVYRLLVGSAILFALIGGYMSASA